MNHRYVSVLRRASTFCGIIVISISIINLNSIAEDKDAVSISIQCPKPEVQSGAKVKLIVKVTNNSKHIIDAVLGANGHAEDMVNFEVRNERGTLLPRIDVNTEVIDGKTVSTPKRYYAGSNPIVNHGDTLTNFAILSDLFNLSKPGKYTVTAEKIWVSFIRSGHKRIDVKSNTIVITVTPKA